MNPNDLPNQSDAFSTNPHGTQPVTSTQPLSTPGDTGPTVPPAFGSAQNKGEQPGESRSAESSSAGQHSPVYSTRVRFTTIVWGLILTVIGMGAIARASGVSFDAQLAGIIVLGISGVVLLVSALVRTVRK